MHETDALQAGDMQSGGCGARMVVRAGWRAGRRAGEQASSGQTTWRVGTRVRSWASGQAGSWARGQAADRHAGRQGVSGSWANGQANAQPFPRPSDDLGYSSALFERFGVTLALFVGIRARGSPE